MVKKGISLVGIKDIKTVEHIRATYPNCYFELSYNSTEQELKNLLPIIKDRVCSIHLLSPQRDFFPNIAFNGKTYQWSEKEILKDAIFGAQIGATNLVLHPGYLINDLISSDTEKRLFQMKNDKFIPYMLDSKTAICTRDYIKTPEYKGAFETMVENAIKLTEKVKTYGVNLLLENLNPRVGYMLIHPEELVKLSSYGLNINLDFGHLFITSILFDLDVLEQCKRILDTNKVKSMHLHSNPSKVNNYRDSHQSIYKYPKYKELLELINKYPTYQIAEVLEEPEQNVKVLFS